jgi:putative salt-induced outer membrane protein YdiY
MNVMCARLVSRPQPRLGRRFRHPWPALALLCSAATAQTPPDGLWHGDIGIGGSSASGNTSATALNLRVETSRSTAADKLNLYALANYGTSESKGVRTRSADLVRLAGRYDRNIDERLFAFGGGEAESNEAGGVRSRLSGNVGAGWYLLRNDAAQWQVFTGVGHSGTRFSDGSHRSGAEWLFGESSTHPLGESTVFKQRLVLYPGAREIGNRASFESSLATAIVGGWTFNAGLVLRYTSEVAPGLKKGERLLTFGFGYKY